MNGAPYIEVFPMVIGEYKNHSNIDVSAEVERVASLLAEFGGKITAPWTTLMSKRGGDAVGARLSSWAEVSNSRPTQAVAQCRVGCMTIQRYASAVRQQHPGTTQGLRDEKKVLFGRVVTGLWMVHTR